MEVKSPMNDALNGTKIQLQNSMHPDHLETSDAPKMIQNAWRT